MTKKAESGTRQARGGPRWLAAAIFLGAISTAATLWTAGCLEESPRRPLGSSCGQDADCEGALVCLFGRCRSRCAFDQDCPAGGSCVPAIDDPSVRVCTLPDEGCESGEDCPEGLLCDPEGLCRAPCGDEGCGDGLECIGGLCLESELPTDGDGDGDGDADLDADLDGDTDLDADGRGDANTDADAVDADAVDGDAPSACSVTATPAVVSAAAGETVEIALEAVDPDPSVTLRLLAAPALPGAAVETTAPGNPATGRFLWVPPPSEADSYSMIRFLAMDDVGEVRCEGAASITVATRLELSFGRLRYDRVRGAALFDVFVTHLGAEAVTAAERLHVVVVALHPAGLEVTSPSTMIGGLPAMDLSPSFGVDAVLLPGETSEGTTVTISNPDRFRMSFWVRVEAAP